MDRRIYHPHYLWEDHKNGFYNVGIPSKEKEDKCIKLLSDQELFWDTMCQMMVDWKYCFEFNVSNHTQNRKAWLGQAACCYNYGVEFNITIKAWQKLNDKTKVEANKTAQNMIILFEREKLNYAKKTYKHERNGRCTATYCMDF